jgi:hypothetical protein
VRSHDHDLLAPQLNGSSSFVSQPRRGPTHLQHIRLRDAYHGIVYLLGRSTSCLSASLRTKKLGAVAEQLTHHEGSEWELLSVHSN